jgi:EAL domain-containing protein (putative c-di-GMP-specific phosphodiesterase class I)
MRPIRDETRKRVAEIACASTPVGEIEPPPLSSKEHSQRLQRVREVLASEDITPFYQPIVELSSGRVIAYEALSRFPGDPAHTADRWFKDAWDLGLGIQLELLAVRVIARSLPQIPSDVGVTLNASPPTMAASGFMSSLGAQARRVTVELTEHLQIEDYRDLRAALSPLQQAGGKTAIDDFGAGYASLAHIVKLDPDWIKLDITLTNEIADNPVAHALATALVSFAEGMGIGVIAEGIESEDELDALQEIGVRFGQGFHLGMPAPLGEALSQSKRLRA